MARKLDRNAAGEPSAPSGSGYQQDVTRSLVRITSIWTSRDYQSAFARGAGVPDEPNALRAIFELAWHGPLRPTTLANRLDISAPAVSRLLETLARTGHVIRTPDPHDARATRIELTEHGAQAAATLHQLGDALSRRVLDAWTDAERETFTRLLHRYADAVEHDARKP